MLLTVYNGESAADCAASALRHVIQKECRGPGGSAGHTVKMLDRQRVKQAAADAAMLEMNDSRVSGFTNWSEGN